MSRLRHQTSRAIATRLAAITLSLISQSVIAHCSSGPEVFGAYALAHLLPTLAANIATTALIAANVHLMAHKRLDSGSAVRATLLVWASLSLLLGVVSLGVVFLNSWHGLNISVALATACWAVFTCALLQGAAVSVLTGFSAINTLSVLQVIFPSAYLMFLGLSLAVFKPSMIQLLCIHVVALAIAAFISLVLTYRVGFSLNAARYSRRPTNVGNYVLGLTRYGLPASGAATLALINLRLDLMVVGYMMGSNAAGLYFAATQVADRISFPSQVVGMVILPRQAKASIETGSERLTILSCHVVAFIDVAFAALLALFASRLVPFVFGSAYIPSVVPLLILLPANVLNSTSRLIAGYFTATGRPSVNLASGVSSAILSLLATLALVPAMGIAGAAIATTVGYGGSLMIRLWVFSKITRLPFFAPLVPTKASIRRILGFH